MLGAAGLAGAAMMPSFAFADAHEVEAIQQRQDIPDLIKNLKPMIRDVVPITQEERMARIGKAQRLMGEQKIDAPARGLDTLMAKTPDPAWLLLSPGVWLLLLLSAAASFVLARTVFGVHTVAVGSSEATARLCGIRVPRVKGAVYTLSGLCAGLAGCLQFARLTVGDPTTALGKELDNPRHHPGLGAGLDGKADAEG